MPEDPPAEDASNGPNAPVLNESTSSAIPKPDYPSFMDDPMLTEFGWPVGDDIFSSIWADSAIGPL